MREGGPWKGRSWLREKVETFLAPHISLLLSYHPIPKRMNGECATLMLGFERFTLVVQSSGSRLTTTGIQTQGQDM